MKRKRLKIPFLYAIILPYCPCLFLGGALGAITASGSESSGTGPARWDLWCVWALSKCPARVTPDTTLAFKDCCPLDLQVSVALPRDDEPLTMKACVFQGGVFQWHLTHLFIRMIHLFSVELAKDGCQEVYSEAKSYLLPDRQVYSCPRSGFLTHIGLPFPYLKYFDCCFPPPHQEILPAFAGSTQQLPCFIRSEFT